MTLELRRYERPEGRFAIDLPAQSEILEDVDGIALVAVEPADIGAFRANLNIVIERLGEPLDLDDYLERSVEVQQRQMSRFRLLDRAPAVLGDGLDARRTLAVHEVDGVAVVLEQWRTVRDDLGYVLSASCGGLDYDEVADTMSTCAESFRLT